VEPYNPIEVYFNSLPAWDGKTDYIGRLADSVPVSNKTYWENCFRKWIVGVVGCALEEHFVNHQVLVLVGRQGIRKSTFINNLLPPALRDYIYSGHIDPRDKDCVIHLGQRILINFDEMEGLNRRNLGLLKELITKQTFNLRKPYGRKHERFIRRASFAGSVNNFDFLLDETGNRRFLGIEVTGEINTEHGIDIDGVMAQALHLYKHEEFCPWFTLAEIETVEEQNDAFRGRTMQEEALLCCFERCSVDEATERLTATEVLTELHRTHGLQIGNRELQQLGRAMRAQGFVRYKTGGQWKYAVRRVAEKRASFSSAQS
jgi:predicted P-loop ATPase